MNNQLSQKITESLKTLRDARSLREGSKKLFNSLGYHSQRTEEVGSVSEFLEIFDSNKSITTKRRALFDHWRSVDIVFQITNSEMNVPQHQHQRSIFSDLEFDRGRVQSFLFLAVEMQSGTYSRTCLANTTRAVNLIFKMPVIVLFRHGTTLTLAAVHRRMNKRDNERDVLEKVTLIKDIRIEKPHRAHIDILSELELTNLVDSGVQNFDKLHESWEQKLDIETLNKRFYKELFSWFQRAIEECEFPDDGADSGYRERHVIRLITRLLFTWFLREKGLVPGELFDKNFARLNVRDHSSESTNYYRVVLQNLFFATLNTEINMRSFGAGSSVENQSFNYFHYHDLMLDPDSLLEKLNLVPFVNGGLFDCLDDFATHSSDRKLVDCFTDDHNVREELQIPAHLFFDNQNGLFTLFNKYKFTVEESTPLDQEVALDPELLGRVFENLLAAYNPETSETVRKTTGSFYTPRPIVDYMVRETLVEALATKSKPDDGDFTFWKERLHYLLNHSDAMEDAKEIFELTEKLSVVTAISEIRAIDPAVGSGTFPMAILQTLTLALRRLDPDNVLWEKIQKEDAKSRAKIEISTTFEKYRKSDFGRKLYLIQKCIYGVDIQPIACQIAKLRFFISLIIDQETDFNATNFGIKPLPNLETRFVAADTLLQLEQTNQSVVQTQYVEQLQQELLNNQERHFHAGTRSQKLDIQNKHKQLRTELANQLRNAEAGFHTDFAQKIEQWQPYNQNKCANWFDPWYMFGVSNKFDVAIGNPPYIQLQKGRGKLAQRYKETNYSTFSRSGDIYCLFYEKGIQLLKQEGHLCLITSNKWMRAAYGEKLRECLNDRCTKLLLDFPGVKIFESATVDTNIILIQNKPNAPQSPKAAKFKSEYIRDLRLGTLSIQDYVNKNCVKIPDFGQGPWIIASDNEMNLKKKIEHVGMPLGKWSLSIYRGITSGCNEAFIVSDKQKKELVNEDPHSIDLLKPVLRGADIGRYQINWKQTWLLDIHNGFKSSTNGNSWVPGVDVNEYPAVKKHLDGFFPKLQNRQDQGDTPYNLRSCAYYEEFLKCKIIYPHITQKFPFVYDEGKFFTNNACYIITGNNIKYLVGWLNSNIFRLFTEYYFPTLSEKGREIGKEYFVKVPVLIPNKSTLETIESLVGQINCTLHTIQHSQTKSPPPPS